MTLRDLIDQAERGDPDRLLTISEVIQVTGRPRATVKRWVYERKGSAPPVMESEPAGPYGHRHVRASVILRMFCHHLVRVDGPPTPIPPGPVRRLSGPMRPCGPLGAKVA